MPEPMPQATYATDSSADPDAVPTSAPAPAPTPEMTAWTVWPLRERPRAAAGLLLAVVGLGGLAGILGGDLSWGLLAAFLVSAWLHDFLLPTRFQVDGEGIVARGGLFTRRLRWPDATRLVIDDRGGWLGRARGSRWRRRGLSIFWGPDRGIGDSILAIAERAAPRVERRDLRGAARDRIRRREVVPSAGERGGPPTVPTQAGTFEVEP